ncbi:hypothetical protein K443DRAFT_94802 [Laccaria amethystina LaAM-08-1]|uniref:Uncharacterized protein n=1 Tax=Laccaria amethystina LaAM-08-1 TaxID=1095629 RepID=A0A0C9Y0S4_9AGAR|nr:hypothetical protein K443DRAFT_94802 [Laccaria amethystina LaAM-08-1]
MTSTFFFFKLPAFIRALDPCLRHSTRPFLQHGSQLAGGKPPGPPGTHLPSEEAYIRICKP